jgi:uncharacterized protein YfaS (alpha-2-macroglobulin family)
MRIKSASAAILFVIIFLSCNRKTVSLDFTSAKGEVPQLSNLVFRFDKALVPDSLINTWDSTDYISFEPKIHGRFRWEAPDQLVFSPSEPLAPATDYTARFSTELVRYSKFDMEKADADIEFHTAPLHLDDAQVMWVLQDEATRTAVPQLSLSFNYAVKPEDLQDKLQVLVDGTKTQISFQTISPSNTIVVRLAGFRGDDRDYEAKVVLAKGIRPEGGNHGSGEEIQTALSIPSPYVLNINNVESEHDGTEGTVRISTSQALTGENINSHIHFDPAVPYTVEYTDEGITLRSEKFNAENSYAMTISKGLRGRIGGVLKEDYQGGIAFGELESDVTFTNKKAVYLSKRGGGNIQVRITNTPKVKLIISKIYESNLLMAERYGYSPSDDRSDSDGEEGEGDDEGSYSDAMAGDVVFTKEIDTRTLPKVGADRVLNLSQFEDRLPDLKGVYHVLIRSTKDYWVRDSRFITLSDIGLIAKEGEDKMTVFANSIKTATGLSGVTINVYGANNQLLGTGSTNSDGAAEVVMSRRSFAGFTPAMVIAKTADDFTYLPFSSTRVNTSRFDVGGKRLNATGLDAFIYAERDIYRPGEKVNFAVLLRDRKWKSPGEIPITLKFLMPNGRELKAFRKTLNDGGAAEGSVDISGAAITGTYTLEVYSSTDILLASKNFAIEEFVPDRIKVAAKLDKPYLRPGDDAALSINAVNFFGPPAANRAYEMEVQVKQKTFRPKNFPGYEFGLDNQRSFHHKEVREGKTNAAGSATEAYRVPEIYRNAGLLQASFYTTVFDETGRPVSRVTTADIYTQDVYNGIKDDAFYYYPLNQPVKFSLVSVNKDGAAVTATARVQVIKHEYKTVLTKSGSYFRYESQKTDRLLVNGDLTVGGNTPYVYVPRTPGDYEVRISRPGANSYVSKRFYSYGAWGGDNHSFEVNNEGQIEIELDKAAYNTGETARVLFKTPFSGRMLVTTERDGLLSYQYLNVENRTATINLKLDAGHVPNIYITATLIKPHEISDIPLTVAHGFQSVTVEERSRQLPVAIAANTVSRSQKRQTVRVKAAPNSYVTLAAVDNGVLQVSGFETPDPYHYYYQKRALEVTAFDMYPLLFPELRGRLSSTGGDGETDMSKRVNPMPAKRIRILSYWSGIRKTDGSGNAEFTVDIPQFSGQVRLMAVACKDDRFGSAEATMQVSDPVVISSALPRFLSPGDTATIPVTLSNTTGKAASGDATLKVTGPLRVVGTSTQTITMESNSETRPVFRVVAEPSVGIAKISLSIKAMGETFTEVTEISVRPPSTLQKRTGSGSIVGGQSQRLVLPQSDLIPSSTEYDLLVSRSPVVEIADQLRYLVQYPFGCTEQTISAAFPQLYFGEFADLVNARGDYKSAANTNVIEAIRKIKMRQLYNGAVTLWDGEEKESWWTTVYAAHFLIEARKAGFDVDNSLLETMLGYLSNRLKTKETITYYYNRDQNRKIAPKEVAYSLYVLALANRSSVSAMNYYKSNPQFLALDSRYLLSAAYAVAGDKRSFVSFLPASFSGEASVQQTGGSFYSESRDEAIALGALIDVDPGNAQVPVMAKHVAARLKAERWLNTQERAFSFLALGKLARGAARSTATAEIKVDGKTVAKVGDANWKGGKALIGSGQVEISASGKGRLYYSWQVSGISSTGAFKEEDAFVKVRRSYFDRYGNPIAGNSFRQNDLVIVAITLEKSYSNPIENIVITDLLPAGFEIENPRTKEIPGMDWIKNPGLPTALDVRDDRIHFFVDAYQSKQTFYYAVRAVSLGTFRRGPVSADAMYNGEMHSYNGAGVVVIR